jgi:hypothetical protein
VNRFADPAATALHTPRRARGVDRDALRRQRFADDPAATTAPAVAALVASACDLIAQRARACFEDLSDFEESDLLAVELDEHDLGPAGVAERAERLRAVVILVFELECGLHRVNRLPIRPGSCASRACASA